MKHGKRYREAAKLVDAEKSYDIPEAVAVLKSMPGTKFDETVELAVRLGVDPRHADQMVRGTVVLPNGLGRSKRVLVIASGEKIREAEEAGADFVGGEDMVEKIQKQNWLDYDAVVATPDMMRSVGRLGKILGPRGLMPNPKTGTVTVDISRAVREVKAGKVGFATDKLLENASTVIQAVIKAKPAVAKGRYVRSATICSTMGPGVALDTTTMNAKTV